MKRLICMLLALVLCLSMAVSAAASDYVPSIGDKDEPDIEFPPDIEFGSMYDDLVITTVQEARDVPPADRKSHEQELLNVYDKIVAGTMQVPASEGMILRELIDASLLCSHNDAHVAELAQPGVTISIWFDLGIGPNDEVEVLTYIDGVWTPIERVVNEGDGWVMCTFEDICPIAFCVKPAPEEPTDPSQPGGESGGESGGSVKPGGSPETGDIAIPQLILWTVLLLGSLAAVVVLLLSKRRKSKKQH